MALLNDGRIAEILRFIWHREVKIVDALVVFHNPMERCNILKRVGKHIIKVERSKQVELVTAGQVKQKLVYIKTKYNGPYVIRNPNQYGHGVIN